MEKCDECGKQINEQMGICAKCYLNTIPLKDRLRNAGYEVVRVYDDKGKFKGASYYKDGIIAHKTPLASYELGLEICEAAGC